MAKLTTETRGELPEKAFALPGRRYPIHDASHARDALSRVAANGTPHEQRVVKVAVAKRFPGIKHDGPEKMDPEDDSVTKAIKASLRAVSVKSMTKPHTDGMDDM
jgi:hypothetical protein